VEFLTLRGGLMMRTSHDATEVRHRSGDTADTCVPDLLLPEQYFDRWATQASDSPEKRLMFAVLLDAVIQLRGRSQRNVLEAEQWIRGLACDSSPFSFRNICAALGIEADYLARGLLSWHTRTAAIPRSTSLRQRRTSHTPITPPSPRRRGLALAS
jgi:hypothetical protein